MKIIILGYTGYIGQSVLNNLLMNTSYKLICVGRNVKNRFSLNKRIEFINWDFVTFKSKDLKFLKKANIIINCTGKINKIPKKSRQLI